MFTIQPRPGRRRWDALPVYLLLEGLSAFLFQLVMPIYAVYYATIVGLDPLPLVLIGTVFETTIFLCEVPTGVVADVYSRRLSIIIGLLLMGIAWVIEGLFPILAVLLLAEIVSGLGVTFTSGATEAWITDEIGVARTGQAFVRAAQVKTLGSILGIIASVALASIQLNLPFIVSGLLLMALGVWLAIYMPEDGFRPRPAAERQSWRALYETIRDGIKLIRLRPVLLFILAIAFVVAFHGEGFDHLWQLHFLTNFSLPAIGAFKPIVWFGFVGLVANLLSIGLHEIVRRRVDLNAHQATGRALTLIYGLIAAGIVGFALAGDVFAAIALYCCIAALRQVSEPVSRAWLNQSLEPATRATLFSLHGQINALGEIIGGPPVGAIGRFFSVRAALAATGLVLALTLPLFAFVLRRERTIVTVEAE
jgi:DHA3 family tetracycline resistance protein-like MFS transporter